MSDLRGRLPDFGLIPLVRFLSLQGRSGRLTISQAGWVGQVGFDRGRIVAAATGRERGQAALELMALALADGDFVYADSPVGTEERETADSTDLQVDFERFMSSETGRTATPLLLSVPHVSELADEREDNEV